MPPPYADAFFTMSTALAVALLAVLVALRNELRWIALVVALAMTPVLAAPFVAGYTPALGLLDVVLLTLVALVAGLSLRTRASPTEPSSDRAWPFDDAMVFVLAVAVAAIVSDRVLERYTVSGDEWADVYQADLFAHLHSFGAPRACSAVFKNWWVFEKSGRTFAQYTPGWPLFMAPFQRAHAVWLAGPFTFGVMAVGVARLARRTARTIVAQRFVRIAGLVAPLAVAASPSAILNGASLYPHTMVCACFAWMVEGVFASETASKRARVAWGIVVGTASVLVLATRPMDGAALIAGVGFVALFVSSPRPYARLVAAGGAFAFWSLVVLAILHAQMGVWFQTAYAISPVQLHLDAPALRQLPYAVPFDRAAPYWWPCSVALVPLALLLARGRGRAVTWMLAVAAALLTGAYAFLDAGRDGAESGYGSRFHLPLLVPMGVAFGVVVAWLVERATASRRWVDVLAASAFVLASLQGVIVVAPTIYPAWHATLHRDHALRRAIAESGIHHAVVVVHQTDLAQEVWDLTQNLPSESDPDVLVITDWHAEEDFACARRTYADRAWYGAVGHERVELRLER
jgi:hypothetical protein